MNRIPTGRSQFPQGGPHGELGREGLLIKEGFLEEAAERLGGRDRAKDKEEILHNIRLELSLIHI